MGILDMFSLENRIAVVTGASRGLGAAFAAALAEAGANLVIASRHKEELENTAGEIRKANREVLPLQCDITSEEQVKALVERTLEKYGKIDVLINNAATERCNIPPEETSLSDWKSVINTNITGPFICSREAGRVMIRQRRGKIINIASISGLIINRYFHGGSYDVSKLAIVALTKALAVEWAPHNITVNAIAPGYYATKPNLRWFDSNPDVYRKVIEMIPLGRLGNIRELSALVVALASDMSNYMTGSVIVIDGGYTIW